jgi:hypothetical protein
MSRYYPILKGKAAEFWALANMSEDVRPLLTPIIDVAPVPWDFAAEQPARTIDQHLASLAGQILSSWGDDPILVDVSLLAVEERMADGRHPLAYLAGSARSEGVRLIPVTGLGRDDDHYAAVMEAVSLDRLGVAIRLEPDDFLLGSDDLAAQCLELVDRLGTSGPKCRVIVDFGDIRAEDTGPVVLAAESLCTALLQAAEWQAVIFAATSFPNSLSDLAPFSPTILGRGEFAAWRALAAGGYGLEGRVDFADYGVAPTLPPEIDPRIMRMSAKLKYTTDTAWVVARTRDVRRFGHGQFLTLCEALVAREEFCGAAYSAGDAYFADCAAGDDGPGNATSWLKAAVSHHLTVVARQVASLT